ncbi:hypothetical protein [Halomonas huangheensis]|uniref:Uncharacterized protein n=1 Tax=Halomonas huangheensis TaxID=1178482 RepID=W1N845_9GAMM|nr:hypothetical protein [Halomonas huangheensis]ALM53092.1 hypothetical protein AR456_12985 [Halomonas huangheensis]ERL51341.1 hypothetical protein BJB45_14205 [Halomonas huangheensis]
MNLPLFLLVLAVCLLIFGSVLAILMLSGTPRYRTEPEHLLSLFERVLDDNLSEDEWNAISHYPIRHNDYLDGVRRRANRLMDEHGRFARVARGKSILDSEGAKELRALHAHLLAHTRLHQQHQG